jgi:hypothetical protein
VKSSIARVLTVVVAGLLAAPMACTPPGDSTPANKQWMGRMVINSPVEQAERNVLQVFNVMLEPPPSKSGPHLSSQQAIDAARRAGHGENEGASAVTPRLALYTRWNRSMRAKPLHKDLLVWILRFEGVCVPVMGPPQPFPPQCAGTEINVVVDASTGRVLEAYSYR